MPSGNSPQPKSFGRRLPHSATGVVLALLTAALLLGVPAGAATAKRRSRWHIHVEALRRTVRRRAINRPRDCANADSPAISSSVETIRAAVVCLINKERSGRRLPSLRASGLLDRSAQGWTNAMVSDGIFTHGSNFAARISAVGFSWSVAGENIATGFMTPRAVVAAWMASTGHCENILTPTYTEVGTGMNRQPVGGADGPTWTQDFALPMGQRAPSANWGPESGCPY